MVIDDLENSLNAKQREICLSQDNYLRRTISDISGYCKKQ